MIDRAVADRLEALLSSRPIKHRVFPGGDISGAAHIRLANDREVVVKTSPVAAQEGRMLEALAAIGAPVPAVLASEPDILVLEYLGESTPFTQSHWAAISEALDTLRHADAKTYGWDEDYALRSVTVPNSQRTKWTEFWRDQRLLCHTPSLPIDLARRSERLAERLDDFLPADPPIALVHGDLWGGNIVAGQNGEIWLIDPCAYYGDREVDLAALTVFDRPPQGFFEGMHLEPGWRQRFAVYRLWMWLIHIRLFGEGYRGAAERDFRFLGC